VFKPRSPKQKSAPKPTYECLYCEKKPLDYKKHLLTHERDYESWKLGSTLHKAEADFYKKHKELCAECKAWKEAECQKHARKRRNDEDKCECCRCRHAREALLPNKARLYACGFCVDHQVFNQWDSYFIHIKNHLCDPAFTWSISRIIYDLILANPTLSRAASNWSVDSGTRLPQSWLANPKFWKTDKRLESLRHDLQAYDDTKGSDQDAMALISKAHIALAASPEPVDSLPMSLRGQASPTRSSYNYPTPAPYVPPASHAPPAIPQPRVGGATNNAATSLAATQGASSSGSNTQYRAFPVGFYH
jgi:hypothetical protein